MSQNDDILRHLKSRPITPIEALNNYQCFRLAARIYDLKMRGWQITTTEIDRNGKKFAMYRLNQKNQPKLN